MIPPASRPPCSRRCALLAALLLAPLGVLAQDALEAATRDSQQAAQRASERITEYRQETSDVNKARAKAALAELDIGIVRLEELANQAANPDQRQTIIARVDEMKDRRNSLRAAYNDGRIGEFKSDAKGGWDRLKGWVRDKTGNEADGTASTTEPGVIGADEDYAIEPEIGRQPSPQSERREAEARNEAALEQQALALDEIDRQLRRLKNQIDDLSGEPKEMAEARLESLRDRRDDLDMNYTRARLGALAQDIDAEIERLRAAAE